MGVVSVSSIMLSMTAEIVSSREAASVLPLFLQLIITAIAQMAKIMSLFISVALYLRLLTNSQAVWADFTFTSV